MKRLGEPETNVAPVATRLWVDAAISSRDFASYKSTEIVSLSPFPLQAVALSSHSVIVPFKA